MPALSTILAALGGLVLGGGLVALLCRRRERRARRARLEMETRLRRVVVPVLERRADTLGIPPSARGTDADGPLALTMTLASAIRVEEESGDLPFGDTLEVSRASISGERGAVGAEGER